MTLKEYVKTIDKANKLIRDLGDSNECKQFIILDKGAILNYDMFITHIRAKFPSDWQSVLMSEVTIKSYSDDRKIDIRVGVSWKDNTPFTPHRYHTFFITTA